MKRHLLLDERNYAFLTVSARTCDTSGGSELMES